MAKRKITPPRGPSDTNAGVLLNNMFLTNTDLLLQMAETSAGGEVAQRKEQVQQWLTAVLGPQVMQAPGLCRVATELDRVIFDKDLWNGASLLRYGEDRAKKLGAVFDSIRKRFEIINKAQDNLRRS